MKFLVDANGVGKFDRGEWGEVVDYVIGNTWNKTMLASEDLFYG